MISSPGSRDDIEPIGSTTMKQMHFISLGLIPRSLLRLFRFGENEKSANTSELALGFFIPGTQWRITSHNTGVYGTSINNALLPGRVFPFPKSLYAVEDVLRFYVANKPDAIILDFFSGSGTTTNAVMRLNKQDGGNRQCISVTNNEVGAEEQRGHREQRLRPGGDEWEK